jgi:hypothetical protein
MAGLEGWGSTAPAPKVMSISRRSVSWDKASAAKSWADLFPLEYGDLAGNFHGKRPLKKGHWVTGNSCVNMIVYGENEKNETIFWEHRYLNWGQRWSKHSMQPTINHGNGWSNLTNWNEIWHEQSWELTKPRMGREHSGWSVSVAYPPIHHESKPVNPKTQADFGHSKFIHWISGKSDRHWSAPVCLLLWNISKLTTTWLVFPTRNREYLGEQNENGESLK